MTRAEWLDYFETVNGRKPSVQEMADALKAGEFVNEEPVKAEETATAEPIKVRQKSLRQMLILHQLKEHQ